MSTVPKILFVDDEPAVLAGLRNALRLRRSQWDMEFANGGPEAIAAMERTEFSVIVSDLRMPALDGADVLRRASELHPATMRILLTGFGDREALARVMPWSQLVLAKPMGARDVAAVVARACAIHAMLDDAGAIAVAARFATLTAPVTFATLAALRFDDRIDVDVVRAILERDPETTRDMFELAGSSAFGHGSPPTTAHELAARFDLDTLTSLSLFAHVLARGPDRDPARPDAALALAIAKRTAVPEPALAYEAFAAGLFHDAGELVAEPRHVHAGVQLLGRCGLPLVVLEAIAQRGPLAGAVCEVH